jgi:murein DD-endopeptidase MepM/ murein hydrolase activator NlpD
VRRPAPATGRSAGLLLALLALGLVSAGGQAKPAPQGPVIRLTYRSLRPGEPILVFLDAGTMVRAATVTFLGQTAELRPAPGNPVGAAGPIVTDGKSVFAFLGIDVETKPGSYVMTVKVRKAGGLVEEIRKDLVIAGREFASAKLQLNPDYVTPPASVRERIKREAELVALAMSVVTPEWLGQGPFARPHDAPSWSNFGQRRLNNNVVQSLHTGLDLRVPFGEPIAASNAGRVVMASDLYLGGKTVIIDHGLGVFSTYGHMSKLLVKRGESVKKGQTIGLCGTTGRSTGPHLHWSFKIFNARIDPDAMLRLPL